MKLVFEKAARKGLAKMSPKAASAMLERLEAIAAAPRGRHPNVKPLVGHKDAYRLRQGDWRAVYVLDYSTDEMQVILIDVSGSVYR
jgi:mRNA interferase RelE/StbE